MKRLVSCLMAALLVFSLSLPAYAATADDLANKLYSGWTQTSSPTGVGSSWYAIVRQFLNSLDSNVSTIKTNSNSILSKLDSIINSYLHYIDSDTSNISTNSNSIVTALGSSSYGSVTYQMSQIRTLLTTISNASSAWTSSQASTVTDKISTIDSTLSESYTSLFNSESWLSEIYNNSVTIDSDTSSLRINSDDLKTGWFVYPQLQRPQAKAGYQGSWYFGVLQSLYNFRSDFSISNMTRGRVEGFTDSDFSHLTFSEGIYSMLYRMQQVLADDDDLQMRQDSEENKNVAKDSFLSYDSDTSVKPDDIGGLSNLGSGLRNNFDTGTVEASNLFDFWGSDNTFSWFTQETKDNMVNVSSSGSGSRRARAQNDEPIYYSPYGEHMEEYERLMREGIK